MVKLDKTDTELIAILRLNARTSVIKLAKQLGVSRATVQNRMRRLEKEGLIVNYTITLKPEADLTPVRALMSITTESKSEARVIEILRGNPNIVSIHHTTGRWDIIVEIRTDTLASFNTSVGRIRLIEGITQTETNLLLDSHDYSR